MSFSKNQDLGIFGAMYSVDRLETLHRGTVQVETATVMMLLDKELHTTGS